MISLVAGVDLTFLMNVIMGNKSASSFPRAKRGAAVLTLGFEFSDTL